MSSKPNISAVICTRNRGDSVVIAVRSILANTHPSFELIVIDQSDTRETELAVAEFQADPRFYYISTNTSGLGRSRNIGLQVARAEIVAFTDDDCSVPSNWLSAIEAIFTQHLRVTVIFSNVEAGPHDHTAGFIPAYKRRESKIIRNFWDKCEARGIGAGMAVRREQILHIGGFDEMLGAGSFFLSCEDADIAIRAIAMGQWVYEAAEIAVIHYGFRTWREGRALAQRDWLGIGASYIKPLRAGHWGMLIVVLYELFVPCLLEPLKPLLILRPPRGLGRMFAFLRGFFGGMRQPIDREHIAYQSIPKTPIIIKA
jgi:glycosyltransferase involved in cell wall biosynthesis